MLMIKFNVLNKRNSKIHYILLHKRKLINEQLINCDTQVWTS